MRTWMALPLLGLMACAPYPYSHYEVGVEHVVVDDVVESSVSWEWVYEPPYNDVEVYVSVSWDGYDSPANLDLEVETPEGYNISSYSPTYGDCEHFGDDLGYGGHGVEEVSCFDPWLGTFRIRILNRSFDRAHAFVNVQFVEIDSYSDTVRDYQNDVWLDAGENVSLPLSIQ